MAVIALPLIAKELRHMTGTIKSRRGKALGLVDSGVSSDTATDAVPKRRLSRGTLPRRKPPSDEWHPLIMAAIVLTILTTFLNAYFAYRVNSSVIKTLETLGGQRNDEFATLQRDFEELRKRLNNVE